MLSAIGRRLPCGSRWFLSLCLCKRHPAVLPYCHAALCCPIAMLPCAAVLCAVHRCRSERWGWFRVSWLVPSFCVMSPIPIPIFFIERCRVFERKLLAGVQLVRSWLFPRVCTLRVPGYIPGYTQMRHSGTHGV